MTVPDWVQDAIFYQVFPDRFANGDSANDPPNLQPWGARPTTRGFQGGDLEGVIQHFDYLLDLGITALYLNPIFQATSNHRYNTYDYYTIDPKLGNMDTFRRLLDLAHRHGVRVILDGVFNHCGRGFFAFHDLLENEQDSPYREWFHVAGFPLDPYSPTKPANYRSWWNIKSLPKFNTGHPQVRAFLLGVARHWMEQGADGWRLDVPNEIDDDAFWAEFADGVKGVNPQAYTCGEMWEVNSRWVGPGHFDGLMNYPLRKAGLDFFAADDIPPSEFADRVEALLGVYPREHVFAQLNLLGSHDTERILTLAEGDVRRVKLAALFQFTYPGAPCVYYGDEIGLRGGKDPECRRAFPWDERKWNHSLRQHFKALIALRRGTPALRRGDLRRVLVDDAQDLYAYARVSGDSGALVVLHGDDRRVALDLPVAPLDWQDGLAVREALTGKTFGVANGQVRGINLGPRSGAVFVPATYEFHISRRARDVYQFDDSLFSLSGNVVFANFHAARVFAQRINQRRDLVSFPEQAVKAGQINALGLIDEIMHFVVGLYREQISPDFARQALEWLQAKLGPEVVDETLHRFCDEFPTVAVYRRQTALADYLEAATGGVPNRLVVLEEMLMLWLANANPAFAPYLELFDDLALEKETGYASMVGALHGFFATRPTFGPENQNLVDMLRSPAIAVPHSLSGQLEYILERWGSLLGQYWYRLLGSLDLIKEEQKMIFLGAGPAQAPVYGLGGLELEGERYTPDRDWMPRLVMIARNAYVWLDQLSKKHRRSITRLDQIPDEELDTLARWGITGLWLIGLWERSAASQRIKQMCGNPEAVASAYSLFDYQIANDLGGQAALQSLGQRAWARGLRLASDMVPNHTGIDSKWMMEHPDWFLALDYSPYPAYTFNGPDLSWDSRVGIYLEDHYYSRADAAVVFKRVDRGSGREKYIYHGNDGTSMPWNDTAQLNYLNPEVREAVIQTILHVARQFPIIRFDAAMTLAKRHIQRLWFPEPGAGGAIPSRADFGLTRAQFDALMPAEFWREVVDRAAIEAPDTLLLAEAFWMMEGYFVRTLGMHRVYNSAFMNMLRDEDNAQYRALIKNTLEFDPEILKRYVNFMNNPDERTAIDQFGQDDKYFGVCTLLATMPGLPMFGHGQVEGLAEKYGMEYRRAYWDEQPDGYLVQRHEREIFPLLHRRHLFAGVEHFRLYDFFAPEGHVNEDVFAYSNRFGSEPALVVYHNKYASARGWVRTSAAYTAKTGQGDERRLAQASLGDGLGLHAEADHFVIFRDQASGLEFLRSSQDICERGLYVELGAYQSHVFIDFREVQDNEWRHYAHLADYLNGRGVPSVDEALQEVLLQPLHYAFKDLVQADVFRRLIGSRATERDGEVEVELLDEVEMKTRRLLGEVKRYASGDGDDEAIAQEIRRKLVALLRLPVFERGLKLPRARRSKLSIDFLKSRLDESPHVWDTLLGWLFTHALGKAVREPGFEAYSRSWIDEWLLGKIVAGVLSELGADEPTAWRSVATIKVLASHQRWYATQAAGANRAYRVLAAWLSDAEVQQFLQVNRYQGVLWFNQEAFDDWLWWMQAIAVISLSADPARPAAKAAEAIEACHAVVRKLQQAEGKSGYQVEKLLSAAKGANA